LQKHNTQEVFFQSLIEGLASVSCHTGAPRALSGLVEALDKEERMVKYTVLALTLTLAACGPATPPPKSSGPAVSAADAKAGCVKLREKQRACTADFIPALVDMRIKVDVPPGIAAAAKSDGREALVAKAMEEWKGDSTDEAIAAMCEKMPMPPNATAAQKEAVAKCQSVTDCKAFVGCFLPVLEELLASGKPKP